MGSKQVGLEPPTTIDGRPEKGLICVNNTLIVDSITFAGRIIIFKSRQ